jgi:hypothetical protein
MSIIRETLEKAYNSASMRVMGLGMSNVYGMTPAERLESRKVYDQAQEDMLLAKMALDAFNRHPAASSRTSEEK